LSGGGLGYSVLQVLFEYQIPRAQMKRLVSVASQTE
jgi:hypothetical protein